MSLIALANWAGFGLAAAGGLGAGYALYRRPVVFRDRRSVTVFGAVWIAVLLLEFYALGPLSFISMNIDGNAGIAFYTYLVDEHLGGQVAHAYGGGHDVDTVVGFGTQFFSIERILFSQLPTWLGSLVLKTAVAALGFIGAYRLVRATGKTGRTVSAGLAALFTVAVSYNINATTWNGLGYAVLPWVIYLAFARHGRRLYFIGLIALGIMAATTEPLHTFLAIAATVVGGAVLMGRLNVRAIVLPMAVIFGFVLANWHEVFYALKQIAPLTIRGRVGFGELTFLEALWKAMVSFPILRGAAAVMVGSILVLAYRRNAFVWKAIGAGVVLIACYVALAWIPWEAVGLDVVKGVSPHYLYFSTSALMLPIAARAIGAQEERKGWQAAPVFAIAVALLISYKVENVANYVYYGGQSQYSTIENLAAPDWGRTEPFRVVTLRHQRPEPELLAAFYGLDTYDAALSLTAEAYSIYWRDGILKGKGFEKFFGRLTLERRHFSGPAYDIDNQADLALLGAANVAFIISPVPLKGSVRLVSGPEAPPARPADGLTAFAKDRLSRITHYGKVYVYALAEVLPLSFAARAIRRVDVETDEKEFLKIVSGVALSRAVVVRSGEGFVAPNAGLKTMRVIGVSKIVNGYDAVIDAPDGGVLVLNVPHMPFWTATTAVGKQLPISPVNMVHMAVTVPAGAKSVSFRYHRPTLREKVVSLF